MSFLSMALRALPTEGWLQHIPRARDAGLVNRYIKRAMRLSLSVSSRPHSDSVLKSFSVVDVFRQMPGVERARQDFSAAEAASRSSPRRSRSS